MITHINPNMSGWRAIASMRPML